jgi:peptidoglycan L-alanyl-D-glutamate endopeptidase CwlK
MTATVARALSTVSKSRLATCHPDLIRLVEAVSADTPVMVTCGHRNRAEQDAAFNGGQSKAAWPNSYHNQTPALAVDLAPLTPSKAQPGRMVIDWSDLKAFDELGAKVKATAISLGIPIAWGGDWRRFVDRPHYQLGPEHPAVKAWRESRPVPSHTS